ncbi:HAD-superfamily hydrolase [Natrialba hulunbeirensis JCM 10989]|uniref:HAD-superfamily hydrolase n=1 Tax=Natrialba hulunbeirensis JCM 10989 TaxID=1227493 RepID=M0A5U5_9EURY|nr:HAD family hydrolase [Natrialba hulunbeirensis]ELY93924.1 HAD-superfamily hydrolase [Natrialba hulunbeirensis JCM 10989]
MSSGVDEEPDEWEAVFWDIGGVILDLESVQAAHAAAIEEFCERHELETPADEAVETWRTAVGECFRSRDGTEFRAAREAYAVGFEAVADEPVPREAWRPAFEETVQETIEPVPGVVEAIETLADSDLHVGVISDVDDEAGREMLAQFGVREQFDSITTSEEVGRTKPDATIFETALEKADVSPERSLMIGDRYDHDVKGAAEVGMHGVAFGAEEGPAVSYRIVSPLEVLEIVGAAGR